MPAAKLLVGTNSHSLCEEWLGVLIRSGLSSVPRTILQDGASGNIY